MAEETSNGGLVFGIRLDNSALAKDVELSQKLFESIGKSAEETGKVIQHWFSDMQIVPKIDAAKFSKELDQVRTAMTESATKSGQGYNKAFSDLYVAAGNAGAKVREESTKTATSVSEDINKLNVGFNSITGLASKMFLGVSAGQIVSQMFQTRSYFQDAESSMKVFLGDAEKGTKFISELKDYAFYNMFEFKDLVGASKQLIAYGVAAEDVTGILDKLSNIATGTGASLNDMVAMYNKAKSVGKVDSQGLESWAARGVLVKKTLKEMGEEVTGTTITFEQLDKALDKVTGEGGMFHNLMAEQLNNLSASYAQLQDNLTSMYEELGEKAEPFMKGAIDLAGTLVENYEGITDAVLEVAKVYGAFKLVDMAGIPDILGNLEQQQQQANTESILVETYKEHSEELQKMLTAEQAHALEMSELEEGTKEYAVAIQDMIASENERAESALSSISTELDAESARKEKLDELKSATEEQIATYQKSGDTKKVEALQTRLETVQEEQNASAKKINELQTKKTLAAIDAETAARNREKLATMQSTAAVQSHSRAMMLMNKMSSALNSGLTKLGKVLDGMGLTNPYALAIAGAIALYDAIKSIITAETELEQLSNKVDETKADAYKETMSEIRTRGINEDFQKVEELAKSAFGSQEYKDALNELIEKYPVLNSLMQDATKDAGSQEGMLQILANGYDSVTEAIYAKNKAVANEKLIDENKKAVDDQNAEALKEFKEAMEDMDYDEAAVEAIGEQYRMALMKGMKIEEMPKEVQKVFQDYKGGTGERVLDFLGLGSFMNKSNEGGYWASWQQDMLSMVGKADEGYARFNTKLEANQRARERQAENIKKVNGELKEEAENLKKVGEETDKQSEQDYQFNPLLKELTEKQQAAKAALESLTIEQLGYEQMSKEDADAAKAYVKSLRDDYDDLTAQIKKYTKRLYGDPNEAKQAYKKQIDLYKNFAQQYTSLEVKRQNEIKKLNDSRNAKGANQDVIDAQIANIYNKTEDDINTLFAKFYGVSDATAAKVKQIFDNALNTPIDAAKVRLNQIREQQERIKNAAANGDTIATKEQQAALEAEAAGLQQVIDLARQAEDERISAMQRIAALQREHDEKSLSAEGKKQKAIKETYDTVRKELASMLEKGQISKEQYEEVLFGLNSDEMRESSDEWVAAYGDYAQKREKLVREWFAKLKDVPAEYLTVAEEQMKKDLASMDFEKFKKDIKWDTLFEDVSSMSSKRLVATIDELQSAFALIKDDMTVEQIEEYKKAIGTLNDELAAKNPWRGIVDSLKQIRQTKDRLPELVQKEKDALKEAKKAQKEYNDTLKEEKRIREELERTNGDAETQNKLQIQLADNLTKQANAKEKAKKATKEHAEATEQVVKAEKTLSDENAKLYGSIGKIGGVISQAGNAFSQLGDAMGESGEKMRELGDTLSSIGETISSTMQAIASGDKGQAIAAAATNTINMITTIVASRKKYQQEQKEWKLAQERFADNMQVAEIEKVRNRNKDKNVFYTDYNAQADDAAEAFRMAQDKLSKQIDKLEKEGKAKKGQRGGVDWGATGKAAAMGAGAGAAIGSLAGPVGAAIGAAIGGVVGFVGGLFGGRKKKDIWGGLLVEFPELIEMGVDGEERINTALADQLIEQGMVNDKTKEMIESAKKYQEEMDAAKQEVTEIVSQLTGDLGNNIMDALVDAFKAGTDSAEAFGDTVDKVLENMIKKLIFNAAFSQYLDKLQKKYEKIFMSGASETEKVTMLMNATKEFKDEAQSGVAVMNELLQQTSDFGDKLGMNLFKADEAQRNAVTGGIANVTQDTAEEMNGRLTNIMSHTYSINESCRQLVQFSGQQLTVLQAIHIDTGSLVRTVTAMKNTIDDITIRGVKMRA